MIKRKYSDGSENRQHIKDVALVIGNRIGSTLGPGGRNYMTPLGITNDGVSILNEMRFSDECQDSLADAFQEVARRQDEDAGDGTTTATLLTTALTPLVLDDVTPIETPIPGSKTVMDIKRQLESELSTVLTHLSTLKQTDVDLEELRHVASTAMEGHPSSDLIAETVHEVGYNSNTMIKEGFSGSVEAKVVPGMHMPLKIEVPTMFTNPTAKEAAYENPLVIVANHVFEAYSDLTTFMNTMIAQKKERKEKPQPIVIIGKHFSTQFTAQIVNVSRQSKLPILLLNANGLTDDEFRDMAIYCGAKYYDTHPKDPDPIANMTYHEAGTVEHLIAGPEQTSFTGGRGIEEGTVQMRIAELKKLATEEQNPEQRELLKRRAAGLDGGVATLFVDAKTAVDRYYLKKKVEDTINSCKAALEYGTLSGGGLALKEVAEMMPMHVDNNEKRDPQCIEVPSYLSRALTVVYDRVQQNAGGSLEIDTTTVRDSYHTVECAIKNAVAVVSLLVTLEGTIAEPDRDLTDDLAQKLNLV